MITGHIAERLAELDGEILDLVETLHDDATDEDVSDGEFFANYEALHELEQMRQALTQEFELSIG